MPERATELLRELLDGRRISIRGIGAGSSSSTRSHHRQRERVPLEDEGAVVSENQVAPLQEILVILSAEFRKQNGDSLQGLGQTRPDSARRLVAAGRACR